MPIADSRARRHAWIVTFLLAAALAAAAGFGIEHEFGAARERFPHCVHACHEPTRPGSVWAFGALAAVLLLAAGLLAIRDLRRRSVELVLGGFQPVRQ
jgi:putative copper export protein